jgi:uncharacterized protein YpuA (DUF1002 family)
MFKGFMKSIKGIGIAAVMALAMVGSSLAAMPTRAYADTSRVVTIGADLTDQQKETVLSFFGLKDSDLNDMQVITVTNEDERKYLSSSVPSSEIGTKTLSCSYIQPKSSGGINVQTANLTYVTKEVLYNALQTAGVENCDLVVTAPYDVSGTGALTGVFMAYEKTGNVLDSDKEEAATKEMVETSDLQNKYGEAAPEVVSDVKNQVAGNTDLSDDQIRDIIKKAAAAKGISLTDDDIDTILSIAKQVQDGGYSKDAFSNTLKDAEARLSGKKEQADGFVGAVQSFFQSIGDFFAKLFGIAQDKGDSIIDNLNTNVYSLDNSNKSGSRNENSGSTASDTSSSADATENGNATATSNMTDNANENANGTMAEQQNVSADNANVTSSN